MVTMEIIIEQTDRLCQREIEREGGRGEDNGRGVQTENHGVIGNYLKMAGAQRWAHRGSGDMEICPPLASHVWEKKKRRLKCPPGCLYSRLDMMKCPVGRPVSGETKCMYKTDLTVSFFFLVGVVRVCCHLSPPWFLTTAGAGMWWKFAPCSL